MQVGRAARTIVCSGLMGDVDLSGWKSGPLPLAIRQGDRLVVADAQGRSQLLSPHAQRMVTEGPVVARHWCWLDGDLAQAGFWAAEIVRYLPSTRGGKARACLVLQHSSKPEGDSLDALKGVFTPLPADAVSSVLPEFEQRQLRGRSAVFELRLLTARSGWGVTGPADPNLTPQDEWLWRLASGTVSAHEDFAQVLPEHRRMAISGTMFASEVTPDVNLLTWSSDWQALVLRDGVGFIGRNADRDGPIAEWAERKLECHRDADFIDFGELYMRTVYADVFIVGDFQRWGLADLSLAVVDEPGMIMGSTLRSARQLDSDLANFRRRDWWEHVAPGGPANGLLRAYQDQHDLSQVLARVSSDVEDGARLASQEADQRLSGALAVISTIGLPVAACLAAADLLTPEGIGWTERLLILGAGLVASATLSAVLLLVFPGLRAALQDSFRRRD